MSTADRALNVTNFVGGLARLGEKAVPFAAFLAAVYPPMLPVAAALAAASPYLATIERAAPVAASLIEDGHDALDALDRAAPLLKQHLRELLAIAINHDPERPEAKIVGEQVDDRALVVFAQHAVLGRSMTFEEEARWFDIAKGGI